MAVTCVFGMTQSGKSFLVEKKIIPQVDRVLIFDIAKCFSCPDTFLMGPGLAQENMAIQRAFEIATKSPKKFKICVRTAGKADDRKCFDKLAVMATILGRNLANDGKRILFVVDEADFICSDKFQSAQLKHIVNKGRHDNVDSLFIARLPQRLHGDIKANASTVISFQIPTAGEISFFVTNFGKAIAERIKKLPKFHFFTWKDTGEMFFTDDKGRKYQ